MTGQPTAAAAVCRLALGSVARPIREARTDFERRMIEAYLTQTGGNVTQAARLAGVDRVVLHRMIKRLGVK